MIGGFRSDLSITSKTDGNFGNVVRNNIKNNVDLKKNYYVQPTILAIIYIYSFCLWLVWGDLPCKNDECSSYHLGVKIAVLVAVRVLSLKRYIESAL